MVNHVRYQCNGASQVTQSVKNLPANAGDVGLIPGSGRSPWKRRWRPILVFSPGEFHGRRSLAATVHGVAKSWTQLSD